MRYASLLLVIFALNLTASQKEIPPISSFSFPEFRACFAMPPKESAIVAEQRALGDGSCPAYKLPLGLWQKIALELVDAST